MSFTELLETMSANFKQWQGLTSSFKHKLVASCENSVGGFH